MDTKEENKSRPRYASLDALRGITLLSMILYHLTWDLVYIAGADFGWFETRLGYVWQQSICWTFILLSGFCWPLGRKKAKRAAVVFTAGAVVSLVTMLFTYEQRIMFGILTFLGTAMFLMIGLDKLCKKISPCAGLIISVISFLATKEVNRGYLGIGRIRWLELPPEWYENGLFTTFLGFPERGFFSTDYFSVFPWIFLFTAGYFLYGTVEKAGILNEELGGKLKRTPFAALGKHSLLIYMLHQPVLYLAVILLT